MKKLIILSITLLSLFSCSKDEPKISGLNDFSGKFRVSWFNNNENNLCSNSIYEKTYDLKINKDHTFEQKFYQTDNNNDCKFIETLKGKINITGSFYGGPNGKIEYFNSNRNYSIHISPSVNGKHNKLHFDNDNQGSASQTFYQRVE
jgi:hypothetical protein